ncbi:MAG: CcmD family protein [Ferruginibacter sp.]|nr:CcmD family protein [Ferruginibacter sp.]
MDKRFSFFVFRFLFLVCGILYNTAAIAQDSEPEMADMMRSNGKIYVVVAVCLTILIGLFIYVFLIDRKISRLEKGRD